MVKADMIATFKGHINRQEIEGYRPGAGRWDEFNLASWMAQILGAVCSDPLLNYSMFYGKMQRA